MSVIRFLLLVGVDFQSRSEKSRKLVRLSVKYFAAGLPTNLCCKKKTRVRWICLKSVDQMLSFIYFGNCSINTKHFVTLLKESIWRKWELAKSYGVDQGIVTLNNIILVCTFLQFSTDSTILNRYSMSCCTGVGGRGNTSTSGFIMCV